MLPTYCMDNLCSLEGNVWSAGLWWSANYKGVACILPEEHKLEVHIQVVHIEQVDYTWEDHISQVDHTREDHIPQEDHTQEDHMRQVDRTQEDHIPQVDRTQVECKRAVLGWVCPRVGDCNQVSGV